MLIIDGVRRFFAYAAAAAAAMRLRFSMPFTRRYAIC